MNTLSEHYQDGLQALPSGGKKIRNLISKTAMVGSADHLHGNFGGKFPSNGTGIFLAPKTGTGLSCTIYKIPVKFSLSLDIKPGTSNPNK